MYIDRREDLSMKNNINYSKLAKAGTKKTKKEKFVKFTAIIMVLAILSSILISLFISLSAL